MPIHKLVAILVVLLQAEVLCFAASDPIQSPKYGPDAIPLTSSYGYFKDHFPPVFWHMMPYFVPQENEWSCGIASTAMVLNAARAILKMTPHLKSNQPLVNEKDMIQFLQKDSFLKSKKVQSMGFTLPELKEFIGATMREYHIQNGQIEIVQMNLDPQLYEKENKLHDLLSQLETSDRHLIIANFNQGVFTGDVEVGHYSPIAAYDSTNKRVLIFDTDRKWFEPYWVSEATLLRGMKTLDKKSKNNRGFLHIALRSNP